MTAQPARILIIDDDGDYRASTRALLEGEGYEVMEASSGQEGLSMTREHRPDLVIVDVMMEGLDTGYSVTQAIKFVPEFRDGGRIPILMVSSVGVDPAELYGWIGNTDRISPDVYLAKPLDIPVFLESVRKLLTEEEGKV